MFGPQQHRKKGRKEKRTGGREGGSNPPSWIKIFILIRLTHICSVLASFPVSLNLCNLLSWLISETNLIQKKTASHFRDELESPTASVGWSTCPEESPLLHLGRPMKGPSK